MASRRRTKLAAAALIGFGLGLTVVSLYNVYEDVVFRGDPFSVTIAENIPSMVLNACLLSIGYWMIAHEEGDEYAPDILKGAGTTTATMLFVTAWVFAFQQFQQGFQPIYLLADALTVSALVGGVLGFSITRRKKQKQEYRSQRARFLTVFENVPDAVVGVSTKGDRRTIRMVNSAFEEVFGMSADELEGRPLAEFVAERGTGGEMPKPTPTKRDWADREVILETPNGRREFVELNAPDVTDTGLQSRYEVFVDVTEQRQRQERLQVLSRALRHDLRNKLSVVRGNATALRDTSTVDVPEPPLDRIENAANDLISLSERAREIERIVARDDTVREPVELTKAVDRAIAEVDREFPHAEYQVDAPDEVWVDGASALTTVLENLVRNAIEHNDSDDPWVEVSVESEENADFVSVIVEDNGPGIPHQEYEVVFGERERTQLEHASGLGLWLVNWVVTDVGGEVSFRENEPRGTIVTVRLPRSEAPEIEENEQKPGEKASER